MTAVLLPHHHQQQPVPASANIDLVEHRCIVGDSVSAISHYSLAIYIRRILRLFVCLHFVLAAPEHCKMR